MKSLVRSVCRWWSRGGTAAVPAKRELLQIEVLEPRVLLSAKLPVEIDHDAVASSVRDDKYEDNDTFFKAKNLGTLKAPGNYADLISADDDWFKFTTTRTGTAASFVQIGFSHSQGDLDLQLYGAGSSTTVLKNSGSTGNVEQISLQGLAAGTYFLRVFNFAGTESGQSYDLSIAGPNSANQAHTLYLNFDGAAISRADLLRWEGGGQWLTGTLGRFDAGANGINILPLLNGNALREKVIDGILKNLNSDLKAFGIQAVRHFGLAVEGAFTTTLFLGQSDLDTGFHVACDIDYGNVNSTDIAFVGNEFWGGDAGKQITALSDVALHEAGHTLGLYHVLSGNDRETMGLRYNTPSSKWLQNTAFLNKAYFGYPNHGLPSGTTQNSFQYLRSVYGGPLANLAAAAETFVADTRIPTLADLDCFVDEPFHDEHGHEEHGHDEHDDESFAFTDLSILIGHVSADLADQPVTGGFVFSSTTLWDTGSDSFALSSVFLGGTPVTSRALRFSSL